MLLSVSDLITLLRKSVNVSIPVETPEGEETVVEDTNYLSMTDDDLTLYIKLGVSRAFPDVTRLEDLPEGSAYPVILLAKIELYSMLAVKRADKVDMGADNNNYLKQDQKFQHYMSLIKEAKEEYESWLDNEGQGSVTSHDLLLSNRHYTLRNYGKQKVPKVLLYTDEIADGKVKLHWNVTDTDHFSQYKVYVSTKEPCIDEFKEGAFYKDKLSDSATLVFSTFNIRNNHLTLNGLEEGVTYYVAVLSIERNQVFGFEQTKYEIPLSEEPEEPEIDNPVVEVPSDDKEETPEENPDENGGE